MTEAVMFNGPVKTKTPRFPGMADESFSEMVEGEVTRQQKSLAQWGARMMRAKKY